MTANKGGLCRPRLRGSSLAVQKLRHWLLGELSQPNCQLLARPPACRGTDARRATLRAGAASNQLSCIPEQLRRSMINSARQPHTAGLGIKQKERRLVLTALLSITTGQCARRNSCGRRV